MAVCTTTRCAPLLTCIYPRPGVGLMEILSFQLSLAFLATKRDDRATTTAKCNPPECSRVPPPPRLNQVGQTAARNGFFLGSEIVNAFHLSLSIGYLRSDHLDFSRSVFGSIPSSDASRSFCARASAECQWRLFEEIVQRELLVDHIGKYGEK